MKRQKKHNIPMLDLKKEYVFLKKGIDKQLVGEVAARLRAIYPPELYKGKGIRYLGEALRRKAGKAAVT